MQSGNTFQILITNQINITAKNFNEQVIWLQKKNLLKNFLKDKKSFGATKTK
jgi:hypothetical protein